MANIASKIIALLFCSGILIASRAEGVPPNSIWGLGDFYAGAQFLSTSIPAEVAKKGYHLGLNGSLSWYRSHWVHDFFLGYRYSSFTGSTKNIYHQTATSGISGRRRMGSMDLGPLLELHFGTDNSYTEFRQRDNSVLILLGAQLSKDYYQGSKLLRWGGRLQTNLNLRSQQILLMTLFLQVGFSFNNEPIIPLRDSKPKKRVEAQLDLPIGLDEDLIPIPDPTPKKRLENMFVPETMKTGNKQVTLTLSDKILFDTAMSHLSKASKTYLRKLTELLTRSLSSWEIIEITGHADRRGSDSVNLVLSEARAKSVADYLKVGGIEAKRVSHIGKGERELIDEGLSSEAMARNRRVELKFDGVENADQFVQDIEAIQY